jgi:hypothetical protein
MLIGTAYNNLHNPMRTLTLSERREFNINCAVHGVHWNDVDGASSNEILNKFNRLYPDANKDNFKVLVRFRSGHYNREKSYHDPNIPYSYGIGHHQGYAIDKDDIADDAVNIVKTLGSHILGFQIDNEPAQPREYGLQWMGGVKKFAENFKLIADAVHEVEPDMPIYAPGGGMYQIWNEVARKYLFSVIDFVDVLDMHLYCDISENHNNWLTLLKNIDMMAKSFGKRWVISETNKSIDFLDDDIAFPLFYEMRTSKNPRSYSSIEEMFYDKLRRENPKSLVLPENEQMKAKIVAETAKLHINDFMSSGAEMTCFWTWEKEVPKDWHFRPDYPINPKNIIADYQIFWRYISSKYTPVYQHQMTPYGISSVELPVGKVLRDLNG